MARVGSIKRAMKMTTTFQQKRNHRSNGGFDPQAGFTLIELMVATLVLAVGLTGGLLLIELPQKLLPP